MGIEEDRTEYTQFMRELLRAKFQGLDTEALKTERMILLQSKGNVFAMRALDAAKLHAAPNSRMGSAFWKQARTFELRQFRSGLEE